MNDPYKTLGLDKSASADDIKKAYRKLAKKYHPDLNPGDSSVEQKFKDITQAYGILGDPKQRERFDRGEIDASGQERAQPRGGFYRNYAESGQGAKYSQQGFRFEHGLDDIFADFFSGGAGPGGMGAGGPGGMGGGTGRHSVRRRGADVSYRITVTFLEAAQGAKKRVALAGPGAKQIDVTIPPGTEDGQTLRLKGQGMGGLGGAPAGDALIEVSVEPHPHFRREGRDIHLELPVSLQEAVLGASIEVPTVHGKVTMRIPAGANSGTRLRLRGKGIAPRQGEAGDQYVTLRLLLPEKPDEELKRFVEEWGPKHGYDPRKKAGLS